MNHSIFVQQKEYCSHLKGFQASTMRLDIAASFPSCFQTYLRFLNHQMPLSFRSQIKICENITGNHDKQRRIFRSKKSAAKKQRHIIEDIVKSLWHHKVQRNVNLRENPKYFFSLSKLITISENQ